MDPTHENQLTLYSDAREAISEFAEKFSAAWVEVRKNPTQENADKVEQVMQSVEEFGGTARMLYAALENMEKSDGWEKCDQITSLLEVIGKVEDPYISEDTLDLLMDPDSALWQSGDYVYYLHGITRCIKTDEMIRHIVGIAKSISEVPGKENDVYSSHLGRLMEVLLFAKEGSTDEDDKNKIEEAVCQIADLRDELRHLALIEVLGVENMPGDNLEALRYYRAVAQEEAEAFPAETDVSNVTPMYFMKLAPHVQSGDYRNDSELSFPEMISRHRLGRLETNPHPAAPTIGIEIEVRKTPLLPEEAADWDDQEISAYMTKIRNRFDSTEYAGIPKDHTDTIAFHEFAFSPKNYYLTLSREVQMLKKRGYIPESLRPPVMHITVGGINAMPDDNNENGAFALARIMEATLWSSSHHRLLKRFPLLYRLDDGTDTSIGWDCKGFSGVLDRKSDQFISENERRDINMVEFRTFQFKSLSGMNRTLAAFQTLGAALSAAQKLENLTADKGGEMPIQPAGADDDEVAIAKIWTDFEEKVCRLFNENGLENPKRPYAPVQPENDLKSRYESIFGSGSSLTESGFIAFAEMLRLADADPSSRAGQVVSEARELVIKACRHIAPILFSAQKPQDTERDFTEYSFIE